SPDDVPSFVVVESAPDAVNGSGSEGVFEAFGLDRAAAADLFGFGGVGSAVDEENAAVDTQAGGVVPPRGVVFGGEHVVVRERGSPAHDPASAFGWGFSGGPRTSGPTRS